MSYCLISGGGLLRLLRLNSFLIVYQHGKELDFTEPYKKNCSSDIAGISAEDDERCLSSNYYDIENVTRKLR